MNPEVDKYLNRAKQWQEEMERLRKISLGCGLTEALKWGKPCYSFQKSNIVIIQPFKEFCALMFFKGVLLKDPSDVLEKPGEHSRVARRIPFTGVDEIVERASILEAYIHEAVEVEKAGLEVELEEKTEAVPIEFQRVLEDDSELKTAFEALTPGRQRAYLLYFSGAKRSKTRDRRIEKYIPKILDGKGLRD